jgi:predicted enzyme related to lactoylglutathione lyase
METPGFVLLGAQSQAPLCLGTHSEVHGKSKEPQRFIVQMNTDDIRGEYSRLRGKGVEFLEEPKDDGGPVIFCTFKDPEGNFIQLIQEK